MHFKLLVSSFISYIISFFSLSLSLLFTLVKENSSKINCTLFILKLTPVLLVKVYLICSLLVFCLLIKIISSFFLSSVILIALSNENFLFKISLASCLLSILLYDSINLLIISLIKFSSLHSSLDK